LEFSSRREKDHQTQNSKLYISAKMGYYMGVFNFFIVIPQIVAATILGFLVKELFNSEPVYALIIGGFSMILAGLLTLRVKTQRKIHITENA